MSDKAAQFARRLAARLAARQAAAEPRQVADRRTEQRRADPPLTGAALDRRLAELGITADRRGGGDRRSGRDRRRR